MTGRGNKPTQAAATTKLLWLFLFLCGSTPAIADGTGPLSLAGSVATLPEVHRFVEVQVIDGVTGAVVGSMPLDATLTFTFHAVPKTVSEVRLFPRLPLHRFRLNTSASVLRTPVRAEDGGSGWLHLSAVVEELKELSSHDQTEGNLATAATAMVVVALIAIGRYRLLSLFQLPAFRPPKPQKIAVAVNR
ncbi:unnamed protein product [Trypanosoma congolense IL3000]|uniref:WGS project CAEQ00000000 data, annotated contig 452 n=1 Tax=Trypanosoma congolense (strain IL3000) TaxID=1068625 RepID=F9WG19_TRYCI|nr:unnamed protein product [Trypanosoma congolense IL3000]